MFSQNNCIRALVEYIRIAIRTNETPRHRQRQRFCSTAAAVAAAAAAVSAAE